jgi:hypothetical protein
LPFELLEALSGSAVSWDEVLDLHFEFEGQPFPQQEPSSGASSVIAFVPQTRSFLAGNPCDTADTTAFGVATTRPRGGDASACRFRVA